MCEKKKGVLLVRSNPIAPNPRVEKQARALAKAGYEVDVLGWARNEGFLSVEEKEGYRIHRIQILAVYGSGLSNFPALLMWEIRELVWLVRFGKKYDIFHACDFDTVLPMLIIKFLTGKKLIYDICDYYADHLLRTPQIIKKMIRWIDLRIINLADGVILVDKSRLQQINGSRPKRVAYIYNVPEDRKFPDIQNRNRRNNSKLHIVYVGLLQKTRGLFTLLDCLEKHPEWELDLAGFGGDEKIISERAKELPNVNFYGRIYYDRTLELSAAADVFYALYDPAIPNHKYASPNKVFEAMMLGKPVVVAKNTNVDKVIEKWQCGMVVDYSDPLQIEKVLIELVEDPQLRNVLGRNARKAYDEYYNWGIMEKELVELHDFIIQK